MKRYLPANASGRAKGDAARLQNLLDVAKNLALETRLRESQCMAPQDVVVELAPALLELLHRISHTFHGLLGEP